jgi:hypothetical protein
MRLASILVASFLLVVPLSAQNQSQLKSQLRDKETAAKQDPEALFAAAKWAEQNGLSADAKRIYQAILKVKPDHEGANLGLGNVKVDDKWLPAKDAETARKKAQEAEFKAKGLTEVSGVWVEKEFIADAKKGIFHHDGDVVTKSEKLALLGGKVRHPLTGELISAKDLEKANARQFQIGDGKWVDEKAADQFHADTTHPWEVRTQHCLLVSTLPWKSMQTARDCADEGYMVVKPLLGDIDPPPALRPVVLIASTREEYSAFGAQIGDASSAYGAFLAVPERPFKVEGRDVRAACCTWDDKNWGPYYVHHAAGLAYAGAICAEAGADLPHWLMQGFGSLASRFSTRSVAAHFGKSHVARGGVKDLKAWFSSFDINNEMDSATIEHNIYQAGLLLAFVKDSKDAKVTEAMLEVTKALAAGKSKSAEKAVDKLHALLVSKEAEIKAYLQSVVGK